MPAIRQLPPSVVNKIAAGEVIERPASVVKELTENAVDSGASRVDVTVTQGGGELIRVADNGCGIAADQLLLAVASHATSKIASADDLFHVATLGFRGEALASIAEVSQFLIRSRPEAASAGAELEVIGGSIGEIAPCGAPVGTIVEVRNVFFNTPVRRKFLRTAQTEMGHCSEAFTRIALAYPAVHFTLRHNERVVFDLPPCASWKERIATFFGDDLAGALVEVESQDNGATLSGYVARPTHFRSNNRMQYVFLNGRHIRDRALQHALSEAYRGLLLTGRYPIGFLRLDMPPDAVDVNVHPTKLEVRFADSGRLYSQLLGTLRTRFLTTDLRSTVAAAGALASNDSQDNHSALDDEQANRVRDELIAWAKSGVPASGNDGEASETGGVQNGLELRYDNEHREPLTLNRLDRSWPAAVSAGDPIAPPRAAGLEKPAASGGALANGLSLHARPHAIQIHNRYLVTQNEQGVEVIDQHALHERILYEELRQKVLEGKLETQRLLVPEPVHLTANEAAAALEARDVLAEIGIEVESFGGDTILLSSYPAMLANISPVELLRQMIDQLVSGGKRPDRRDAVDELLHMISCKAAIKAGDRLAPEEITALLERRHLVRDSHHCPHGRPTALIFTREELDRRFQRT